MATATKERKKDQAEEPKTTAKPVDKPAEKPPAVDKQTPSTEPTKNGKPTTDWQTRLVETFPALEKLNDKRRSAQSEVTSAKADLEEAREHLKECEARLATVNDDISKAIWEVKNPAPLFQAQALPNGKPKGGGKPAVAGPVEGDEAWRETQIREALPGLGKKVYEGMERQQLLTMGKLIDWKNRSADVWWTDLEGVGKAACDKIDDAIEAFFTEWRKKATPAAMNKAHDEAKAGLQNGKATMERVAATNAILLEQLPLIKERAPILGGLHLAGLKTIGDVFALADSERASIIDALRAKNLPIDHAGIVDEAIKAAIKDADEAPKDKGSATK